MRKEGQGEERRSAVHTAVSCNYSPSHASLRLLLQLQEDVLRDAAQTQGTYLPSLMIISNN
jgi:hypothetical protein